MAQLNLALSKMRYLKVIVEGHLEKARIESDRSPESKMAIEYKQSILDSIKSSIIHDETEEISIPPGKRVDENYRPRNLK